jgi:hypothetical protein
MSEDFKNKEKVSDFWQGKLTQDERLAMIDDPLMVASLLESMGNRPPVRKESAEPEMLESSVEKLEKLLEGEEMEFAFDLIRSGALQDEDYSVMLEGSRIDDNGRPWPSTFCRKVKESANWGWGEEADAKCYQLLAMLVNHCSEDAEIDFSLTWINSLNLGESGAYGFYEEIKQLDSLVYLATDRNLPDLASKCPKLEHLDFRRCREKVELSVIADCRCLKELDLYSQKEINLSELPSRATLRRLDLRSCWDLESISDLPDLPDLEELELARCGKLVDLGDLSRFPKLRRLGLKECLELKDLDLLDDLDIEELILPDDDEGL